MRYNTILFDADGTLLDFLRSEKEAIIETLTDAGIVPDEEMVKKYSEINDGLWKKLEKKEIERSVLLYHRFELLFEHYGIVADAKRVAVEYINNIAQKGYFIDGAEELLQKLFGKVRMYIITNGAKVVQLGRYEKLGLRKYFDGVFISEVVGVNKPDVKFFQHVEGAIENFDFADTLVVGDSLSSDIKGGNLFGLDTCWYNPQLAECTSQATPTYVAQNFDEVYNIIINGRK